MEPTNATNDRSFAEVANDFETWRGRARELLGCGEWEARWRLAGGAVIAMERWPDDLHDPDPIGPCVMAPRGFRPIATVPAELRPGARREAWFREAHRQLDDDRAAMLGKDGGRA